MITQGVTYVLQAYSPVPYVELRFRFLRDGVVTESEKIMRFFRGWDGLLEPSLVFVGAGEYSDTQRVGLAALQSLEWLCIGRDDQLPRRVRAAYLTLSTGGTYTFNISSGEGGQSGDPAFLTAHVRVDRVPASREIVMLERPIDGEWRLAGSGPTPGGEGEIAVRVVGGDVYAVAVDDYGVQFVAIQAVVLGQRIRPTQYAGWLYEITEAGTLPANEPEWWAAEGDNVPRLLGTARAVAVRYYQPLAHGPVPVEII